MDRQRAATMAIDLMNYHGLLTRGWSFDWHNKKRSLGTCSWRRKTIFLSRHLVAANSEDVILNTILHEIAHALTPNDGGHGREWKLMAISLGAKPQPCSEDAADVNHLAPWRLKCPNPECSVSVSMFRRPKIRRSCRLCSGGYFNEKFLMVLEKVR